MRFNQARLLLDRGHDDAAEASLRALVQEQPTYHDGPRWITARARRSGQHGRGLTVDALGWASLFFFSFVSVGGVGGRS